jgi:NhaA family Na+:H+ antiporter
MALVWANSPWSDTYERLFEETRVVVGLGPIHLDESLAHFINDGLMAIFFFVVGLEIKRELVVGDLRDPKAAALPVVAAVGGMLVPAAVYVAFTAGLGPGIVDGWAIPMATDIAFAVGVVALLGSRVPPGAKLFVLALAIADDLGAIAVIAVFYTSDLSLGWLGIAVAGLAVIWFSQRVGVRSLAFYVPMALAVWFATLESGVHATLAGVALGFMTPVRSLYSSEEFERKAAHILNTYPVGETTEDEEKSDYEAELLAEIATESIAPLNRLENRLLPWSSYVVVPLFALANAGVDFRGVDLSDVLLDRVALGVALGLLVGKTIGISTFTWLAVRLGWGKLPSHTNWRHIVGLASLAGIGFTVSLFITNLAFTDQEVADVAKVGIFAGSLLSGIIGSFLLRRATPSGDEAVP